MQRRWFLSYNSRDQPVAERFEAALHDKNPNGHIYFAPKKLRAGGYWLPELAKAVAEANAFVLLIDEHGLGPWQALEYYEALDRRVQSQNLPIVVVLREGQPAPGLPFLRQLHWFIAADPASQESIAKVMDAAEGGGAPAGELWRHTAPYRGLAAMTEADTDFFFGRGRETVEVIDALATTPEKLPVLLGNSGVGKSSLAQAGVLAAFIRQAWPETAEGAGVWPSVFRDTRRWCFLKVTPGTEPLSALVEAFLETWQLDSTTTDRPKLRAEWLDELLGGKLTLRDLLDQTRRRYAKPQQPEPPAFLLYIDQGEELYVRAGEHQRRRFSELIAQGIAEQRLYAMMSLRADFFGELQKDEALYGVHRQINVPPLREAALREVVSRPAELLKARFETDQLAAHIARRAAEESTKDAGALPLLSYLLDDMWTKMVERGDGVLRLPAKAIELGGVLVDRADAFLEKHPKSADELRRIFTLKLATVREDGEPTRRRAFRSEFSDGEWRLVTELADHPNRLIVTATPEAGETYAEVAHEAIFRRWDRLRDWIAAERLFLAWRTGLEAARRAWEAMPERSKADALLMGAALTQARSWLTKRGQDLLPGDRDFIGRSARRENQARARVRRVQASAYAGLVVIILGLISFINQEFLKEQWNWWRTMRPYMVAQVRPYVLGSDAERALKPGDSFRECAKDCPEMVVVPAGEFLMGSPEDEAGRYTDEDPRHKVTIAKPFAVAKYDVTFDDWDACVSVGGCPREGRANPVFGRDRQPVIYLSWDDAHAYVAWLSSMTGKSYRLLSEAEYEYAARAGTQTAYPWGEEIGKNNADCDGCSSQWDKRQPAPVGSFAPNRFGLYDMVGNVWSWVEDCWHDTYDRAPADGSAWNATNDCKTPVVRGGSWDVPPRYLRAAIRVRFTTGDRGNDLGFRVGRTLTP